MTVDRCLALCYTLGGLSNEQIRKYIDVAFFIDTPLDIALARRFSGRQNSKYIIYV